MYDGTEGLTPERYFTLIAGHKAFIISPAQNWMTTFVTQETTIVACGPAHRIDKTSFLFTKTSVWTTQDESGP